MAEFGERQPDGSVIVYDRDAAGNVREVRRESWAQNQGQAAAGAAAGGTNRQGVHPDIYDMIMKWANNDAMIAYNKALLDFQKFQFANLSEYQTRQLALQEALQTWNQSFQERKLDHEKKLAYDELGQQLSIHQDQMRFSREKLELDEKFRQLDLGLRKQIADDNNQLQRDLQEGRFGHEIAMLTRSQEWQAREAEKNREFQSGEAQKNRELQALEVFSRMRGPKDAFTAEAMRMGLNEQGLSRSVDAVTGRFTPPSVQAEQRPPEAFNVQEAMAGFREATAPAPRMTFTPPGQRMAGPNDQAPPPPFGFDA